MRTILVNPLVARTTIRRGRRVSGKLVRRRAANPLIVPNRRRRRKGSRRRRRNPMMAYSNPLILPNRRRRRNAKFNLAHFGELALWGTVGAAGAYLTNKFIISDLGVGADGNDTPNGMWFRNIARVVLGGMAAAFLPANVGPATLGAMLYPAMSEMDAWWSHRGGIGGTPTNTPSEPTSADLQGVEADLNDVLDGLDF